MTIPCKLHKNKVIPPVFVEEKQLSARVHYLEQDRVNTNHALLQTPTQKLTKIH